jgi:hypothetical protein
VAFVRVHENTHLEESGRDENGRTARRVYEVVANSATSNVAAELATATNPAEYGGATVTIPVLGAAHPADATRVVNKITVERDEESTITKPKFRVTVDYSTPEENEVEPEPEDPLSEPTRYRWSFNPATEPLFRDRSGTPKPIVNSAGEPFETFLEVDSSELMVEIVENVSSYSPVDAIGFIDKVNSNGFTIDGVSIGAGEAKMSGHGAEKNWDAGGTPYYTVNYVIKFKANWKEVELEDRGYNEKDEDNAGKLKEIVKGKPPTKPDRPWPLDGDGAAKANSDDAPELLTFQVYQETSFPNL